jgi:putative addiction module component (TIGR02574 family)
MAVDMREIGRLSVRERVRLVQDIWDSIQPTAEELPLTDEQKEIIDERLAEHRRDPSTAVPWEEVRERLRSKLDSR